jgi:hypothetical protein
MIWLPLCVKSRATLYGVLGDDENGTCSFLEAQSKQLCHGGAADPHLQYDVPYSIALD